MIKIVTQKVTSDRAWFGYSLRVNGRYVRYTINGISITSKDNATIWANVAALRDVWTRYMPTILYLTK